jgi:glycosyltransferase involved in cell wall biosynthesis
MSEAFSGLNNDVTIISPNRVQKEISHKTDIFNFYDVEILFKHKLVNFVDPYIYRHLMPKFIYRFFSFIVNFLWGFKSAKLGKKLNGDFYIFRDNTPFSFLFSVFYSKKCVIEFHDIPPLTSRLIFKLGLIFSKKTICFAVTKKLSEDLYRKFGKLKNLDQIYTLHDGVDLKKFTKKKSSENRIPTVTYCGSLSKSKGIDLIIDAAKLINNVEFIIIGGLKTELDYYKEITINLGVNNVKFVGQVSYSKVPELLNNSDMLLLPATANEIKSKEYTSAMKLFEYLSVGKPIIASNISSNTEILKNEVNCLLFEPDNPESLAGKIEFLIGNKDLKEKLSNNSSRLALKYSWEERSKKVIDKVKN